MQIKSPKDKNLTLLKSDSVPTKQKAHPVKNKALIAKLANPRTHSPATVKTYISKEYLI